jgi:nifR3 family TIM-barrel protein
VNGVTIGSLELKGNLFLAPVAGYTDRAFRSICCELGADFSYTELISSEALTRNPRHYALDSPVNCSSGTLTPGAALIKRGRGEKRYGIQLFGANPDVLGRACALLAPLGPDAVDLNAGCPVPKVTKTGAGSALMRDPLRLGHILEVMVRSSREHLGNVPVTVKMRAGWDNNSINYLECARTAVEAGAAMVSLHPRTRAQGYGGKSSWSFIADLVTRLPVPVAGSGDLYTPEDARHMFDETGCAALMFARGAMGNPFIFSTTKSLLAAGTWTPPGKTERLEIALRHLEMLAEDLGERRACLEMRKQFCAYTKGINGGAALREKIVRSETVAKYRELLL